MPVALLCASCYAQSSKLPDLPSRAADLLELDASLRARGYQTETLEADRSLGDRIREALGAGSARDGVLLYFSGYAGLSKQGSPALLLDSPGAPAALAFDSLHRDLEGAGPGTLLLDVALVVSGAGDALQPFIAALRQAHARQYQGVDVILIARRAKARGMAEDAFFVAELKSRLEGGDRLEPGLFSRVLAAAGDRGLTTAFLGAAPPSSESTDTFDGPLEFDEAEPSSGEGEALGAALPQFGIDSQPPSERADPQTESDATAEVTTAPPKAALAQPLPPPGFPPPTRSLSASVPPPPVRSTSAPSPGVPPPPPKAERATATSPVPPARSYLESPLPGVGTVPPPPPPRSYLESPPPGARTPPPPRTAAESPFPGSVSALGALPPPPRAPGGLAPGGGLLPPPAPPEPSQRRNYPSGFSLAPPPTKAATLAVGIPPPPPPVGMRASASVPPPPPAVMPSGPGSQLSEGPPGPRSGGRKEVVAAHVAPGPVPQREASGSESHPGSSGSGSESAPVDALPSIIVAPHADKPEEHRPPPTPTTVDEAVTLAERYEGAGQHEAAANEYLRALHFIGEGTTPRHVELFVKLGRQQKRAGDMEAALTSFGHAFSIDPARREPVDATLAVLLSQSEFDRAERLLRQHFKAVDDEEQKVAILEAIVGMWTRASQPERSLPALKRWVAVRPDAVVAWQQCIGIEESLGKYDDALVSRHRLAAQIQDNAARADLLIGGAEMARDKMNNPERAHALLLEALSYNPGAPRAVELCAERYTETGDFAALADLYDRALAHGVSSAAIAAEWARGLGRVCTERLDDKDRTVRAYECLLTTGEAKPETYAWLARYYEETSDYARAQVLCRAWALSLPMSAAAYRNAYSLFHKLGAADAAWNAVSVLECLGEADIDESLLADAHKPEGLLAVARNLNFADWSEGGLTPALDPVLAVVFRDALEAILGAKLERMKRHKAIPDLPPEDRQDPESTTTLSRSLMWTARVLGISPPALYLNANGNGSGVLSVVPAPEPSALADKALGSGLSLKELSFLWGRHLSLYRREHQLLAYYPTGSALSDLAHALFSACGREAGSPSAEAKKLASLIQKALDPAARERVAAALVGRTPAEVGGALSAWAEQVRLVGGRAGLLACGDIGVAAALARRFPVAECQPERQVGDVFAYAISAEYASLRHKLGVAVQS